MHSFRDFQKTVSTSSGSKPFPSLFSPIQIGRKRLKNRIVFPAVLPNYAQNHRVTERTICYYGERAKGGAAMLITEGMSIHSTSLPQPSVVKIFDPANVEGFQRMAQAVEAHDCRLIGQLWHVGRQQLWSPVDAPVGVSSLPDAYSWSVPHVMTGDEIKAIIDAYTASAAILQRAGFSGVELHGGHGYLITQFMSPWSNTREDEYGGDVEGRTRFVREIMAAIRVRCGEDFILGLKMPGDEGIAGGVNPDESARIIERLAQEKKLDYVGFAQGNFSPSLEDHVPDMGYAPGPFMDLQKRLRRSAGGILVLAFGRVTDPAHAATLLADGVGDLIGMGRALVSDAALPNKAAAGETERIRPCIFCNQCWAEIHVGKPMACIHNPQLGTPGEALWRPSPASKKRRIVVVGAGVAGLEAAWIAAERGHEVTVLGAKYPGGKARLDSLLPGRAEVAKVFEFQLRRARDAGVKLELGEHTGVDRIMALNPDAVVLATGSHLRRLPLASGSEHGIDARAFVTGLDEFAAKASGTAVLFDQDHGAAVYALADLLAQKYDRLMLLTPRTQLGRQVAYATLLGVYRRLYRAGVEIVYAAMPRSFERGRLVAVNAFSGAETIIDNVSVFVYATPRLADDALAAPLSARGVETHLIGDCFAPRAIMAAVHEGNRAGQQL